MAVYVYYTDIVKLFREIDRVAIKLSSIFSLHPSDHIRDNTSVRLNTWRSWLDNKIQ